MEKKGEVKGPYTRADWITMKAIKESLDYLQGCKPSFKRQIAIKWQQGKFEDEVNKVA